MVRFINRYSIHLSIFLIIILITLSAIFAVYNREVMLENTALKTQIEWIRLKTQSLHNQGVKSSDLTVRAFAISRDEKMLQIALVKRVTNANLDTLENLLKLQKQDLSGFYQVKDTILQYIRFQDEMIELIRKDSMERFRKLFLLDKGNNVWAFYNQFATKLFQKENIMFEKAQQDYEWAMNRNIWIQVLLVGLGIPMLLFMLYRLNQSSANRRKIIQKLDENNRKYLFDSGIQSDLRDGQAIIENAMENLKKASEFVNHIAEGDYQTTFNGLNSENQHLNHKNLVGALLLMQNQLQKVKKEDEMRNWLNQGVNNFVSLIRQYQEDDLSLYVESLIFLVRYSQSQLGSLFVLEHHPIEDVDFLALKASYALDKEKLTHKKFMIGEGLIGQAFVRNKVTLTEDLPEDYAFVASGLGEIKPKHLLLIPITYNQRVVGVLELGCLHKFEPHQIEFLEKSVEFLASTLLFIQKTTTDSETLNRN